MSRLTKFLLPLLVVTTIGNLAFISTVDAVSAADWHAGNIIDDTLFYRGSDLLQNDVQNFLNSQVSSCDTWGTKMYNSSITRAQYGTSKGYPAPYTCVKDFSMSIQGKLADSYCNAIAAGTKSAAQIIYEVSSACKISARVLIVMLEKEQGLISDDWPFSIQYRSAMGYGCPDTAPCDAEYYGFFNQVYNAARQFKLYAANPSSYRYQPYQNNSIYWSPTLSCGASNVYIENKATAGLYNYTPYQPNQAALNNLKGIGDGCSAYGNRNFWRLYSDWFNSTRIDYSAVFDANYYLSANPDLSAVFGNDTVGAFNHFVAYGMNEGRQASAEFNVNTYRNRYADLRGIYGGDLPSYYLHYIRYGKAEGRSGAGTASIQYVTVLNGTNYSSAYDFTSYLSYNPDLQNIFGSNDPAALRHFVAYGMNEGRQASAEFNVNTYRNRYADLRGIYGGDLPSYYLHYIRYGKAEGRSGAGTASIQYVTVLNGTNYSSAYDFTSYLSYNPDLQNIFGSNDPAALRHFVAYGMNEGRQASAEFNVNTYRNRYADLRGIYGGDLPSYYLHYIRYGKAEGRSGN